MISSVEAAAATEEVSYLCLEFTCELANINIMSISIFHFSLC